MTERNRIKAAIATYARGYHQLQALQETSPLIPEGDQKTGCIGEYYSYLYLQYEHPNAALRFGNHSEKAWDIEVTAPDEMPFRVQVKTVSAYSKTRVISPIHRGWNHLHVVYLNKQLQPEGLWIITETNWFDDVAKGKRCPDPFRDGTGSKNMPYGENMIGKLHKAFAAT